jgi:hypothetical protein
VVCCIVRIRLCVCVCVCVECLVSLVLTELSLVELASDPFERGRIP